LGWLRSFEAAARHLSFTGAARELNMTQSAVSQQIKALEGHLGRALFHRRPRALELTTTGVTYLPVVRDAFRTLVQGTRAVTGAARDAVRVQCNLSFAVRWLAPRLPRFRTAHPDVLLSLSTDLWEARDMPEGVDVEIRYSLAPADTVRAELLWQGAYYPVCAPEREASAGRLAEEPLFDCVNLLANWPAWAEGCPGRWPDPPVTYAATFLIGLAAAEAGGGWCLAHDLIAGDALRAGRLVAPSDHRPEMPERYYLIQSPRAERLPGARAFAEWLRAELAVQASFGRDGTQA
jgi:LysR family glycine cleavage system transcriptional activator